MDDGRWTLVTAILRRLRTHRPSSIVFWPEYGQRLLNRQIEYPGDVVAAIANGEHLRFETPPSTSRTAHLDIRQKVHIHHESTGAFAAFTVPTGNIERKVAGSQVAAAGLSRFGEDLADGGKGIGIGRRVGT